MKGNDKKASRRDFLNQMGATVGAAALATAAGSTVARAQERYQWKMATLAPITSNFVQRIGVKFAKHAEALTDGRVKIEVFPAGVLAPAFEVYQAVQDGRADVGSNYPGYLVRQHPVTSLFSAHAGGHGADSFLTWLYQGGGEKLYQEFMREKFGLHILVAGSGPSEVELHSKKPITKPEDLKGLRIRATGAGSDVYTALGAATVTVPGSEVYPMLERGAIDATEWSTPSENLAVGLHEISDYILMPGMHQPSFVFDFCIKADKWDALSQDIRGKLEAAAKITTFESFHEYVIADLAAMEKWAAAGRKVTELDQSYIDAFRKVGYEWAKKHADGGDQWMKRVMDSYYGFLDKWEKHNLWYINQRRGLYK